MFNDTSQYFKNNITQKGLIAGVTSASIGSAFSSSIFIITNDFFLTKAFKDFEIKKNRVVECFDWKKRILYSYILSDICRLICFLPFEARKQRIQLSQKDYTDKVFISNLCRSFVPLLIRDSMTRFITLGLFLSALQVVHSLACPYISSKH